MCPHGPHLELKLTEFVLDTWDTVCHSKCAKCPARRSFPRKTCKFRLSRNSTKIDVVARFRKTIPTANSVSSFEIWKTFGFLPKLGFCHFSENCNFFGSYILPSLKRILSRNSTHIRIQPRAYVTSPNSKTVSGMTTRLRSKLSTTRWLSTNLCQE